jgi:hypothetical protein
VAGRHLFTDTTEHWNRRASLRGASVHHSEAERFIRKAKGTVRSSSFSHMFVTSIGFVTPMQLSTGNGQLAEPS